LFGEFIIIFNKYLTVIRRNSVYTLYIFLYVNIITSFIMNLQKICENCLEISLEHAYTELFNHQ